MTSRRDDLLRLRERLWNELEAATPGMVPQLSGQLLKVLEALGEGEIEAPGKVTPLDEFRQRMQRKHG